MSLHSVLFLPLLTQVLVKAAGERVYQKEVARVTHSGNLASPRKKQGQRGFLVDRVQFSKVRTQCRKGVGHQLTLGRTTALDSTEERCDVSSCAVQRALAFQSRRLSSSRCRQPSIRAEAAENISNPTPSRLGVD